jgi:hypothetical protein
MDTRVRSHHKLQHGRGGCDYHFVRLCSAQDGDSSGQIPEILGQGDDEADGKDSTGIGEENNSTHMEKQWLIRVELHTRQDDLCFQCASRTCVHAWDWDGKLLWPAALGRIISRRPTKRPIVLFVSMASYHRYYLSAF